MSSHGLTDCSPLEVINAVLQPLAAHPASQATGSGAGAHLGCCWRRQPARRRLAPCGCPGQPPPLGFVFVHNIRQQGRGGDSGGGMRPLICSSVPQRLHGLPFGAHGFPNIHIPYPPSQELARRQMEARIADDNLLAIQHKAIEKLHRLVGSGAFGFN